MLLTNVEEGEAEAIRAFIEEHKTAYYLYLTPSTKRYYPFSALASQVLGFVNTEGGVYGLEAGYEDVLKGIPGRVVTGKTAKNVEMYNSYSNYIDAVNGYDLTLTLDSTIQAYAEQAIETGIQAYDVRNGGFCVVMDPKTGAILAMASSPEFDPNSYSAVTDSLLQGEIQADIPGFYEQLKAENAQKPAEEQQTDAELQEQAAAQATAKARETQWRNKAIREPYEPGSTFKALVLAAALEEGVVTENSHFYCPGYIMVEGWSRPISCSKKAPGHGDQDLALAVANSCNPAFVKIGQALGAEKFYDYLEGFGFLEKTGIDMQGEMDTSSLIWPREDFNTVQLATASFGQRFQVTPIQLITAASAVINGGHLMQPYVVSQVTDGEGNVLQHNEPNEVRQVVSAQTSERCRAILEKVVDGGTGKNARVEGYRIGGKTGSSETLETDHTIVSFLGFAPADDPQVIILLAYDNPKPAFPGSNTTAGGWYISGGNMAALMAGELLEDILGHLGVEKTYTANADVLVPNLSGLNLADATSALQKNSLTLRTVGDGGTVTGQIPAAGASIPGGSQVVLYMGEAVPTDQVQVPSVIGLTAEQARQKLADAGLYMRATGATEYGSHVVAYEQSTAAGASVNRGTTIEVRFTDSTASGAGL